ncbi:MAG TPA: flagellar basal body L-ring protein FlgH [Fimbriimonadaceae bacterium]|nr:flagellar basal body L-ring protein FlgH [Fimbriimonadaceae bacterium]
MKGNTVLIGMLLACSALAQDVSKDQNPGSLWPSSGEDFLQDRTARREGDIITILIFENQRSTFSASTTANKNDATSINAGVGPILSRLIPNLRIGANSTVNGDGSTTQNGRFVGRMSAIVRKVHPNGTMEIEGVREIQTNRESQLLKLTGIVRRQDVRNDNTILSENIANASIKAEGKGMIYDRQRKGILTRLVDWLF